MKTITHKCFYLVSLGYVQKKERKDHCKLEVHSSFPYSGISNLCGLSKSFVLDLISILQSCFLWKKS